MLLVTYRGEEEEEAGERSWRGREEEGRTGGEEGRMEGEEGGEEEGEEEGIREGRGGLVGMMEGSVISMMIRPTDE